MNGSPARAEGHVGPREGAGGRLVLCPTPIGNMRDITLRALDCLREADVIACEDTRRTGALLARLGVNAPLVSFHEHNEAARTRELVARIRTGAVVALVCDAGTPLLSDPGHALVQGALAAALPVEVLPGPSAALVGLIASGLPSERFCFVGFLPRRRSDLEPVLLEARETLVAFESPRRLRGTLEVLAEHDPARRVAVCRELTKLHEEVRRGTVAELAAHYAQDAPRGEVVLVVEAAPARAWELDRAVRALSELVRAGARARPAAAVVAEWSGVPANELYRSLTM
jgi:16S rRNA (cytidine1402-2'-O)-methyltransferase